MKISLFLRFAALAAVAGCFPAAPAQDPGHDFIKSRLTAPSSALGYYDALREGVRLYNQAKYHEAADTWQRALKEYPEDGTFWMYLGLALYYDHRPKESVAAYDNALRLHSNGQPQYIYVWMARSYLAAGDKENAYRSLEHAIFDEPHVNRQGIYDDPALAALKPEERFKKLTGHFDTSKMSRTEGWRFDLDYLLSELRRVNHKYKTQPLPAEVTKRFRNLRRDVPKLTDEQIYMEMGRMLAPLKQAHVSMAIFEDTKRSPVKTVPVQYYAFPEGIFIVGADAKNKDLVGSEVLKIEDSSPGVVLRQIEEHSSVENPIKIMWGGMQPLGTLQVLRGLGVLKNPRDEVRLTLRGQDGHTYERTLTAVGVEQNRKLVPPPSVPAPLFLKDVPRAHWFEALPGGDGLFVQLNQVSPDPDETMPQFGMKLRTYLQEHPETKNIVLDVRHNNGGNTSSYTQFLRTLVGFSVKEGNHLYVIIGRGVYSATGNLITDLERLAEPTFVGEPSAGFGNQDGDESVVTLPYSGVHAFLTSVWWQYSHPWDRRRSIIPDVPVQLTAKDYFAGKDPALETILALIHRG